MIAEPIRQLRSARALRVPVALALAGALSLGCGGAEPLPGNTATSAPDRAAPALSTVGPLPPSAVPETFDVATLAERVRPTVVNITTTQRNAGATPFDFFFGPDGAPGPRERTGAGTGFIIDAQGYVITNEHVVRGASDVRVVLSDNRELPATVVGRDEKLDLALLHIEELAEPLPAAVLGRSETLRVGEHVLAVGNPFGLGHTVTLGIVSAKARSIGAGPYDDFIQTDASINPGNSGGPLFNWRGEVVGINTAIRPGANGIGFAIPVDALRDVLEQLRSRGHVVRGKLGLLFQPVTPELADALGLERPHGALVAELQAGSAAARAGVKEGDVIIAVDDTPIEQAEELPRRVARNQPGSKIQLRVLRDGAERVLSATLDRLDEDPSSVAPPTVAPGPTEKAGRLGIEVSDAPGGGVRVDRIDGSSPVRELRTGDIILSINGKPVQDIGVLRDAVDRLEGGTTALLRIKRGDLRRFAAVQIPKKP